MAPLATALPTCYPLCHHLLPHTNYFKLHKAWAHIIQNLCPQVPLTDLSESLWPRHTVGHWDIKLSLDEGNQWRRLRAPGQSWPEAIGKQLTQAALNWLIITNDWFNDSGWSLPSLLSSDIRFPLGSDIIHIDINIYNFPYIKTRDGRLIEILAKLQYGRVQ